MITADRFLTQILRATEARPQTPEILPRVHLPKHAKLSANYRYKLTYRFKPAAPD